MPREPTPTIRRWQLGQRLRELRERSGVKVRAASAEIEVSQATLSKIENGKHGAVKLLYVKALATLYGATDREREELLELAEAAAQPEWFVEHARRSPEWFRQYLGYESAATEIHTYGVELVGGLLQTEAYTRAVGLANQPESSDRDLETYVAVRRARQARLTGDDPPVLHTVLNEAALRRPVGGSEVMREQLERIVELAALDHVTVQVLPFAAGAHPAMTAPFTILGFDLAGMTTIYLENGRGAVYLDGDSDLARYRWVFGRLTELAASPEKSRSILAKVVSDL